MAQHGHGHGHEHGHGHGDPGDFAASVELLDLDGEVFAGYLRDVVDLVADATGDRPVGRVADVGCGSGTGTLALAERFGSAQVVALDVSEPLLEHLGRRAAARGVADRVRPLRVDLDAGWPAGLDALDLVWASVSLHHVADPPARLRDVRAALVPGGVLALVEIDDLSSFQPTFLAGADGPAGRVEASVRELVAPGMVTRMPFLGADWGSLLHDAGFTVEVDRVLDLELRAPLPAATARYATLSLQRMRDQLRDLDGAADLPAAERDVLDRLAGDGPGAVRHRDDLVPRSRRHVWITRARGPRE